MDCRLLIHKILVFVISGSVLCLMSCGRAKYEETYTQGLYFSLDYRYNESITKFKEAIEKNKDYIPAHLSLIDAMFQVGQGREVFEQYKQRCNENPKDKISKYLYAYVLLKNGDVEEANNLIGELVKNGMKHKEVLTTYAYIKELQGDEEKVEEIYKKAARLGSVDAYYYLAAVSKNEEKLKWLKKALKYSKIPGEVYVKIGNYYLEKNQPEKAQEWFKKADKWSREKGIRRYQNVHLSAPLKYEGDKFLEKALYDKAIEKYKEALKLKPDDVHIKNSLGWCYFRNKEYKIAIQEFQETIKISPNNERALNGLAACYNELKRYDLALEYYRKYLEINPLEFIYSNLAILYQEMGKPDEARSILEKGLKIKPKDPHANYIMGTLFAYKKEYEQALKYLKIAEENIDDLNEDYLKSLVFYRISETLFNWKRKVKTIYKTEYNWYYGYYEVPAGTSVVIDEETKDECLKYIRKALEFDPKNKSAQDLLTIVNSAKIISKKR